MSIVASRPQKRGILWLRLHMSDHESQLSPLSTALNTVESKHSQTLCVENLTPEVGFSPSSLLHLFLLTSHSSFLLIEVNHCLCKTLFWALAEALMSGTCYLCLESILSALGNISRGRDAGPRVSLLLLW